MQRKEQRRPIDKLRIISPFGVAFFRGHGIGWLVIGIATGLFRLSYGGMSFRFLLGLFFCLCVGVAWLLLAALFEYWLSLEA